MICRFLDCLNEGVHIVDARGMTVFYNKAASKLDGMEIDEVMGVHVLEAFPSLTQKTSTLLNVLQTGKSIEEKQQSFMNRRGQRVLTVNRTIPLRVRGEVVGAAEISRDITQVKELSDQVIHLQEKMNPTPRRLTSKKQSFYQFADIVTQNPVMLKEIEKAKRAAQTKSPVLVVGETGTGKELFVQSIHSASGRVKGPFIVQNCAAIPSTLLEGILFGTVKGAFTCSEDRPGLFELADGGTLFLDEIQSMPIELQAKLLRALEEGGVRRVGDARFRSVDVRIIVATNEDLLISMQKGKLRKDLYYRIHVVGIHLPPLRERKDDIPCLTRYFFRKLKAEIDSPAGEIDDEVFRLFHQYHWPGNVRELAHTIEGALTLATEKKLSVDHLPAHFKNRKSDAGIQLSTLFKENSKSLREVVREVETRLIRQAMKETGGNVLKAARRLGIPRQTLQYKLKKINSV
ncbi:sigma 54-interacting transcriptional regulator [Thermoactinomyces sp. CICC 10520]|uniref:sigma-54 interaction domain-containing protein n=1 Tax=Thermoactinomyces sp. CICC 10520 TaxID=2767433 RepID=UPI0018DCCA0F|nr:sigma 54-interacting transcriptional regulator [Thermoactinomyces sp. CICC 10520]